MSVFAIKLEKRSPIVLSLSLPMIGKTFKKESIIVDSVKEAAL